MTIAPFTLKSATTNAAAPFSLGHAFKQGEVPVGSELVGPFADLQVVPKNIWPDGSLKFAVVSGRASLTANVALSVQLSIGTPTAGTDLSIADLKAATPVAEIGAGAFGTVSWATTDWDTPFKTVISGPKMSSWVYRKQIGTDAHLVGWLEVRLWSGGEVEILPWIENGYLKVAGPTNKSATYTFTMGAERFNATIDLKHHTRTPLISGAALSYWLGTDPGVSVMHDAAYLQATRLLSTYSASMSVASLSLVSTFTPLDKCNIIYGSDSMASSGFQRPIGMLPTHDVAYMVGTDSPELRYTSVIRNGFAAGRYSIHYRDENNSHRIPKFSTHATLVLNTADSIKDTGASTASNRTPAPAGGYVAQWDLAHCPAVGIMAYLVTGHFYHSETCQFAVTASWLNINNNFPDLAVGTRFVCKPGAVQPRAAAWGIRALAHAIIATPDADTETKAELVALMERIIKNNHDVYVAQPNNQFGLTQPGTGYAALAGGQAMSVFMDDFYTAVFGYALALGLPLQPTYAASLAEFFQWKARFVVGRLGLEQDFWYIRAAPFTVTISPSSAPNFATGAGPWLNSWAEVEAASYSPNYAWAANPTEGVLQAEYDSSSWGTAAWGNLHPAIAYAVEHGVPGAKEGYDRMVNATNYDDIQASFAVHPVWAVAPAVEGVIVTAGFTGPVIRVESSSMIPGMIVCGERGLGILGSSVPSTGTTGPSPVFNDLVFPADAGKSVMWRITRWPATGTLTVYEDCSFTFAPAAAGTETFQYQLYIYGAPVGSPQTVTMSSGVTASAPNAPSVSLIPGDGQVFATVTAPAFNGGSPITSFRVILSTGQVVDGMGPAFTITAANDVAVFATATATNAIGTSVQSAPSATVTPSETLTVPGAPLIGIATAVTNGISIAFAPPTDDGGTPVTSYIATASTGESASGASSPLVITGLSTNSARTVTVVAVNPLGAGPSSAASNSVTPLEPVALPGAPSIISVTAGDGRLIVEFVAPDDDGGSGITGYIATASTGESVTGVTSPLTIEGLENGIARTVTVAAINDAGTGPSSPPSGEATPAGLPTAPRIGVAIADDGVIAVEFDAPVSDGGSPVTSYRAVTSDGNVGISSGSPIIISGLSNGFAQTVTITAINAVGSSLPSEPSNKAVPHQAIAMVPIASIVGRVLIYAPTANTITVTKAIREAAIQLCNDVKLWRYEQAVSYTGSDFIELAGPNQSQVLEVQHARFDGLTIEPRTMRWMDGFMAGWRDGSLTGTPHVYTQIELDRVVLAPVRPGVARFSLVVIPSEDATDLPAFVVDKYRELIAHGALGRVLMIPNQPYSDPGKGALALEEFARQITTMKNRAVYGQQRARTRTRPTYF